ncbi:sigma-54-dependent Fis family transcriptional regulator [Tardiphaga sp. vice304]|uniref:sigma-54-dependent Fis family transcriptional regulator n=1 Tax=Tardiphaga sp. vice304 TaxID=2592817 RepID=UPI001163FF50|nr:sigma-54-dependent Fis family transcriptional regulator [Tardiphaga sp. vice304]QDM29042.1 sigma-54-dependent Fis family transcriptional regulator [Tardiphaga sp. vice304]
MNQRDVRAAWEKFVERGALPTDLRPSVVNSWQRSRNHSVTVDRAMAPLVAEAELFRHRSKHARLRHAARHALENSRTFLSDANSIMILTDPSGLIIDTEGDARVIEAGRTVHLEHGGRWSEADIGTNAIGTAMAEAKPVQIHGAEHFCSQVQRWTCAAVPVFEPTDGELLGVVDISGPAETFNPQSLALAVSVGQHVESVLARSIKQDHELLLHHFLAKRAIWANDDCVLVDRRGTILHASEQALKAIRDVNRGAGDEPPTRFLKTLGFDEWPARLSGLLPNASFDFVASESSGIGAIIVLHARRRAASIDRSVSRQAPAQEARKTASAPAAKQPMPRSPEAEQRRAVQPHASPTNFVAADPAVQAIVRRVEIAAARKMPILIRGETGTGKEQLARHAHAASGRSGAFVPVNCAALPESLIEAELFGYADGSFTGARRGGATGLVKEADGGTLFLDEIGDMPVALQAVLLRLLDDWTVRPIGGARTKVDIFLVSATNAALDKAIAAGRFRSDLLYRLNTLEVTLPRLNERTDFESIVQHLLDGIDPTCEIAAQTMADLAARPWPGNIRELRNILARHTLACSDCLLEQSGGAAAIGQVAQPKPCSLQEIQLATIHAVYAETAGNVSETARRLGVSRNTVYRALGQTAPR